jgi:2-methylcitrate dehydratase PrpD
MADPTTALNALIDSASGLLYSALDESVRDSAVAVIADVLAAARLGLEEAPLRRLQATFGASDRSPGLSPHDAAFLYGCAAVVHELDESLAGGGHPGAHVVPAAVAVAHAGAADGPGPSGPDLVRAVVAGYEVSARLFRAYRPEYPAHPHGLFGAVGAAVAVAMLTGESPVNCAALVASAPLLPGWAPSLSGTTARNAQVGAAAAQAVEAAQLSAAGFIGDLGALTELLPRITRPDAVASVVSSPRNGNWLITESTVRHHAVAHPLNAVVDAMRQLGPVTDDFVAVRLRVPPRLAKFAGPLAPRDLAARMSVSHVAVAALLAETLDVDTFAYSARVAGLADRVEVIVDDSADDSFRAELMVRSGPSASVTRALVRPTGRASIDEVRAKWSRLAQGRMLPVVDHAVRLPQLADCADLFATVAA